MSADRRKRRYAERKAKGLCVGCGGRPPRAGCVRCDPCLEAQRLSVRRNPARQATTDKRRYDERKAKGLCTICGSRPPRPGYFMCGLCTERKQLREENWRAARREKGLCLTCAAPAEKSFCDPCADRHRSWKAKMRERWRTKNICVTCGQNPVSGDRVVCDDCNACNVAWRAEKMRDPQFVERQREARRRRYRERREAGLCVRCGRPSGDSCMCEPCRGKKRTFNSRRRVEQQLAILDLGM